MRWFCWVFSITQNTIVIILIEGIHYLKHGITELEPTIIVHICELVQYLNITDPACQTINTELRCYVLDPTCPSQRLNEETSSSAITYALLGILISIPVVILAAFLIRRLLRNKGLWYVNEIFCSKHRIIPSTT